MLLQLSLKSQVTSDTSNDPGSYAYTSIGIFLRAFALTRDDKHEQCYI